MSNSTVDERSSRADLLAPDTGMGAVTLRVADLDAITDYYRDAVTLSVLAADGDRTVLGRLAHRS